MNSLDVSRWLWDFYLLATGLLLVTGLASFLIAQPARRMAMAWATAGGLVLLLMLTALPNWSLYSLASPTPPEPTWVATLEPVLGTAIQRPTELVATPVTPQTEVTPAAQILVIDWGLLATFALLTGSSIVAIWLVLGAWQVRRLRARAQAVPQNVATLLIEFSPHRSIQLGMLSDLPVPVALGLRQPLILLPQKFVSLANATQLRSVLAHELAHVENLDLWLLALLRLLMILLWPHPLFWLMRSRVRQDQEVLADMAAAKLTTRTTYAEQLVALARSSVESRLPRLVSSVGLWEKPSQLTQRIKLLLDDKLTILQSCSRNWRLGTVAVLGGLVIGLSLVTLTPAETDEDLSQAAARSAEVRHHQGTKSFKELANSVRPNLISGLCLDENSRPIKEVMVDLYESSLGSNEQKYIKVRSTVSDSEGRFSFADVVDIKTAYPNGLGSRYFPVANQKIFAVVGSKAGRVTNAVNSTDVQIAQRGMMCAWRMPPVETLQGQIVDEEGKPVVGAEVRVFLFPKFDGIPELQVNTAVTNDEGKYTLGNLGQYDEAQAKERYKHEIGEKFGKKFQADPRFPNFLPWQQYMVVTHPMFADHHVKIAKIPGNLDVTLRTGKLVTGQVYQQEGAGPKKPAIGVEVIVSGVTNPNTTTLKTKSQGIYRIETLKDGKYQVNFNAEGWFSPGVEIDVNDKNLLQLNDIVMTRGGRVRIQLVDANTNKPLRFANRVKAFVVPHLQSESQKKLFTNNLVEFSTTGVGEQQVPAGKYYFLVSLLGSDEQTKYRDSLFANIRHIEDLHLHPAYQVDEGKILDITIPMVKVSGSGEIETPVPSQRNAAYEDAVFDRPPPAVSK